MTIRMLSIPLRARLSSHAEAWSLAERRYLAKALRRPVSGFLLDHPQPRLPAFLRGGKRRRA